MEVLSVLGREPAMYVGGSWMTADETRFVVNPANEFTVPEVPEATPATSNGRSKRRGAPRGSEPARQA